MTFEKMAFFLIFQLGLHRVVQVLHFLWTGLEAEKGLLSAAGGLGRGQGPGAVCLQEGAEASRQGGVPGRHLRSVAGQPLGTGMCQLGVFGMSTARIHGASEKLADILCLRTVCPHLGTVTSSPFVTICRAL